MRQSGTDAYIPGHGDASYEVEHYELDLDYRVESNRLDGEATLHCRTLEPVSRVELDLHALRPAKVFVDGASVKFTHRLGRLAVTLGRTVPEGQQLEIRVRYSGSPKQVRKRHLGEAGWEELEDGVIVAAQPHGSPSWFPCNDRPDNKARYTIAISVPKGYHVAVAGELVGRRTSGSAVTWTWEQDTPMATYLATVQIGRYVEIEQDGGRCRCGWWRPRTDPVRASRRPSAGSPTCSPSSPGSSGSTPSPPTPR